MPPVRFAYAAIRAETSRFAVFNPAELAVSTRVMVLGLCALNDPLQLDGDRVAART